MNRRGKRLFTNWARFLFQPTRFMALTRSGPGQGAVRFQWSRLAVRGTRLPRHRRSHGPTKVMRSLAAAPAAFLKKAPYTGPPSAKTFRIWVGCVVHGAAGL